MAKESRSHVSEMSKADMKQVLTLSDVFAVGYGDLGSSIYYALGITALYALGAAPLALMLAGFVFACTALTYAEMSSMTVAAGGSANFTRYAMNDLISFIAGWALLLDFVVTIAISAYSVAPYLAFFFPVLHQTQPKIIFTIVLITFLCLLNIWGSKHSTRLSWILTILTLATQATIIIIGAIYLSKPHAFIDHLKIGVANSTFSPSWSEFWKGTAMAMVAYTGIESMAQLTSETKNPRKTVPKAIMWAMGVLLVMYIALSFIALSALTPQALSTTYLEDPIDGIVSALPFGGPLLRPWVGILGATILLVAANAGLVGASRLAFRMGSYYQLPRTFYKLSSRFKTPYVSLTFFATLASLIVLWSRGKLDFLADLYNFGAMLAFFFANLALIILRFKMPEQDRPFKVPFNITLLKKKIKVPIPSIIGCIATFCVWILVIITKPEGRYLGITWIIFGVTTYLIYRKKKNINPIRQLTIEQIHVPEFKKLAFEKMLVAIHGDESPDTIQTACELAKTHGATLTAINIIEVPFSISVNANVGSNLGDSTVYLKRAEAIAREFGMEIECIVLKARSAPKAILDIVKEQGFDLLILGGIVGEKAHYETLREVIKDAPCKVIVAWYKG